jgi:hypothetical protein
MHPTRFRWFIIFLLFAISIINYIDRTAIDILGAFGLGYAITTLLARRSWAASWSTAGLALLSVIVVLVFHDPDRDRPKQMPRPE